MNWIRIIQESGVSKVKVWELEEGKMYFEKEYNNRYIIKNGILYACNFYTSNKSDFEKSILPYNEVLTMNFEEIKREIDWSKVPQGTKVQVRDYKDREWFNRYFYCFNSDCKYIYTVSEIKEDDEYTGATMSNFTNSWIYCRIHESVEIPNSWYKEQV